MATPNPGKVALQRAAADSYSKAGAAMTQAEPLLAKAKVDQALTGEADHADDTGRKTR